MARMACINITAFSIQLLVKKHGDWKNYPVAVLDKDSSYGRILIANTIAQKEGISVGMRYASALSLVNHLRAGTVAEQEIEKGRVLIANHLRRFSPCIESSIEEPGIFWINANGLGSIYPSLRKWATEISAHLHSLDFQRTIVVGFSRFGTYAMAKSSRGVILFENKHAELAASRRVTIDSLARDSRLIDRLTRLNIRSVGEFIRLPADGVLRRFGKEAYQLHCFASGNWDLPLQSDPVSDPVIEMKDFNYPVDNIQLLKPTCEQLLTIVLDRLTKKRQTLETLRVGLTLEDGEEIFIAIRPAVPTMEKQQILTLMSLRLERIILSSGVIELSLQTEGVPLSHEPVDLFAEQSPGDLNRANQALDLIRSEFGNDSVIQAKLQDNHLPEKRFQWVPFSRVTPPKTYGFLETPLLVRRILLKPPRLDPLFFRSGRWGRQTNASYGNSSSKVPKASIYEGGVYSYKRATKFRNNLALKSGCSQKNSWSQIPQTAHKKRMLGPYVISGGWWAKEFNRKYYYAEMSSGGLLWVYYDCLEEGWFLQGDIV